MSHQIDAENAIETPLRQDRSSMGTVVSVRGSAADARWSGPYSWTLVLLVIGVGFGCLHAWYWVKRESRHD